MKSTNRISWFQHNSGRQRSHRSVTAWSMEDFHSASPAVPTVPVTMTTCIFFVFFFNHQNLRPFVSSASEELKVNTTVMLSITSATHRGWMVGWRSVFSVGLVCLHYRRAMNPGRVWAMWDPTFWIRCYPVTNKPALVRAFKMGQCGFVTQ